MEVSSIRINGLQEPLGFKYDHLFITYEINSQEVLVSHSSQIRISLTEDFSDVVYSSGLITNKNECFFEIELSLCSRQRYFVEIQVGDAIGNSWFETGKMTEEWTGKWITPKDKRITHPVLSTKFTTKKSVRKARLYACGLGLYEAMLNDKQVGEEFLAPGYHDYHNWQQVQTYDVIRFWWWGRK